MKLTLLLIIFFCLSCIEEKIQPITYITDKSTVSKFQFQCIDNTINGILQIANNYVDDTLIVMTHSTTSKKCYDYISAFYYKSTDRDSLELILSEVGDIWHAFNSDTIMPFESTNYAINEKAIKFHLSQEESVEYVQLYYPSKYLVKKSNFPALKILFQYNRVDDKITQMNFTIPDGIKKVAIPN